MKRKTGEDPAAEADQSSKEQTKSFDSYELERKQNISFEHGNNKESESEDAVVSTKRTQPGGRTHPGPSSSPRLKETSASGEAPTEIGASRRHDMPSKNQHYITNAMSIDEIRKRRKLSHEREGGNLQMQPQPQQEKPKPQQLQHMIPDRFAAARREAQGRNREMYPHLGSNSMSFPNESGNYPHISSIVQTMHTNGMYNTGSLALNPPRLVQRLQASQQLRNPTWNSSTQLVQHQLSMIQAMQTGPCFSRYAVQSMYNSDYDPLPSPNFLQYSQHMPFTSSLGGVSALMPSFPTQHAIPLATQDDENWLSKYLCYVRAHCVEVFEASMQDALSRNNSKKISEGQVGIRCRFCAHLHHRSRAGRSSSFPSSKSRIYQSLTMMLRDHFPKCGAMPPEAREIFMTLKRSPSQGVTDSKRYWTVSAATLGMIDTPEGIKFAGECN